MCVNSKIATFKKIRLLLEFRMGLFERFIRNHWVEYINGMEAVKRGIRNIRGGFKKISKRAISIIGTAALAATFLVSSCGSNNYIKSLEQRVNSETETQYTIQTNFDSPGKRIGRDYVTVKKGDSLWLIAEENGCETDEEIVKYIQETQRLNPTLNDPSRDTHVVVGGELESSDDIGIRDRLCDVIYPGEIIVLPPHKSAEIYVSESQQETIDSLLNQFSTNSKRLSPRTTRPSNNYASNLESTIDTFHLVFGNWGRAPSYSQQDTYNLVIDPSLAFIFQGSPLERAISWEREDTLNLETNTDTTATYSAPGDTNRIPETSNPANSRIESALPEDSLTPATSRIESALPEDLLLDATELGISPAILKIQEIPSGGYLKGNRTRETIDTDQLTDTSRVSSLDYNQRIMDSYNSGLTIRQIARQNNSNYEDVLSIARSAAYAGILERNRFDRNLAREIGGIEYIKNARAEGRTAREIREQFEKKYGMGVSDSTIYRLTATV